MGGLSWIGCGFLMTWQKLGPFLVLAVVGGGFLGLFMLVGVLSSVVGGALGVGQVQVRLLMAYSSISHWGWILSILGLSAVGSIVYYLFYFGVSLFLFIMLGMVGAWRVGHVRGACGGFLVMGLLSLGGLPPFTGFVSKWVGLQVVSGARLPLLLGGLVLGSVLRLYFYLRFLFVFFLGGVEGPELTRLRGLPGYLVSGGICFLVMGLPFYELLYFLCS